MARELNRAESQCAPTHLRVYDAPDVSSFDVHNEAEPPALSMHDGRDGRAHAGMRLSELYRWALQTGLLPDTGTNHEMVSHTVTLFEQLCNAPPLRIIDRPILTSFIAELSKRRGMKRGSTMAANTILKHYHAVASLLNLAVEEQAIASWRRPRNLPTPEDPEPRVMPPADLEKIIGALRVATIPRLPNIMAEDWWFALLNYLYYTGQRIGHCRGLEWSMVHLEAGLVSATKDIQKGKKRKRVYLHQHLVEVLRSLHAKRAWGDAVECQTAGEERALASHRDRVFPWFAGVPAKGWKVRALSTVHLYRQWHAIQQAAGLQPDPEHGWYGFHDLRRTTGSNLADAHGEQIAADVLGHSVAVLRKHYDASRAAREAKAVQSLPKLPGTEKRKRCADDRTALLPGFEPQRAD